MRDNLETADFDLRPSQFYFAETLEESLLKSKLRLLEIEDQLSSLENYNEFLAASVYATVDIHNDVCALREFFGIRLAAGFSRRYLASREAWRALSKLSADEYHQMAEIFNWAGVLYFQEHIYQSLQDIERYAIYIPSYIDHRELHKSRRAYHQAARDSECDSNSLAHLFKSCLIIRRSISKNLNDMQKIVDLRVLPESKEVAGFYSTRKHVAWVVPYINDYPPLKPIKAIK